MTRRPERVADRIRQVLADIIRGELRDPRVGFVTVTDVRISTDLQHARVYVSFLDRPEQDAGESQPDRDEALAALGHAAPFLRRRLAREAGLRRTPELRFEIDDSVAGGFRIDEILDGITISPEDAPEPSDTDPGESDP